MRHRHLPLLLLIVATLLPVATASADTRDGNPVFFRETGHTLAYGFRTFFDHQGGVPVIGLPLTEVFIEDGRPVQYFERARLEWHADTGTVEAGHLGRWAAERNGDSGSGAFTPLTAPGGGDFFPQTGHALDGEFRTFWHSKGGLATFGFPISEPFVEVNAEDGQGYTVQYFERARFELHRDQPPAYQVLMGLLGRQYLDEHPAPDWALQPVQSARQAWDAVRPSHIAIPRIGVDVDVVEGAWTGDAWDVPRYTAIHYWPISAVPGTQGNIVIAGHVGYRGTIFNQLPNVQQGDEIDVTVGSGQRRYAVREILTLLPSEIWAMNATPDETLTLITCVPFGVYSHRLYVRAVPID